MHVHNSLTKHQLCNEQSSAALPHELLLESSWQLESDRFCMTARVVILQVEVLWRCEEAKLEGSISMMRQKGPAPVYSAPWSTKVSCGPPKPKGTHVIMLQVLQLPVTLVR
jgi:hypothetical protein